MPIRDRAIAWKTRREFIPMRNMLGILDAAGVPTSLGAGTPVFAEAVAAAQLAGLQVGAAGNEVFHFWPIPRDMDRDEPLRFRYHFLHVATDADNPVFKTFYKAIGRQEAATAANSSEDEVVTHAAHTCSTTANSYELTIWGKSASQTKIAPTDIALMIACEIDNLGNASANEINVLGLEIEWTVQATSDQREFTSSLGSAA